jgi:hypothetical protein
MPFKIRKAPKKDLYWVVNTANGRKFSNDPIPFENAQGQLRVLERWAEENRERFHPEETKETRFIQDVVAGMKHGAFTKQAQKHKMGVEDFADHVLANPDFFTMTTRRRAQFLVNIRKKVKKQSGSGMCCCSRRNVRGGDDPPMAPLLSIWNLATNPATINTDLYNHVLDNGGEMINARLRDYLPPYNGEFFSSNYRQKMDFLTAVHDIAVEKFGEEAAKNNFPLPSPAEGAEQHADLRALFRARLQPPR